MKLNRRNWKRWNRQQQSHHFRCVFLIVCINYVWCKCQGDERRHHIWWCKYSSSSGRLDSRIELRYPFGGIQCKIVFRFSGRKWIEHLEYNFICTVLTPLLVHLVDIIPESFGTPSTMLDRCPRSSQQLIEEIKKITSSSKIKPFSYFKHAFTPSAVHLRFPIYEGKRHSKSKNNFVCRSAGHKRK